MSIQAEQEEQAAEGEDEVLNAGQEKCANCKWRTKKGQRCSNMASGYYLDYMEDTEHCVEWEAAPAS